jgi:hypothetical protein
MSGEEERAVARSGRRSDLRGRPFPVLNVDGPNGQRETVRLLKAWAEQEAEEAIDWYLRDKRLKRLGSRWVRGLTVLLAVAGTAVPLGGAVSGGPVQGWGYVLLALGHLLCAVFDVCLECY